MTIRIEKMAKANAIASYMVNENSPEAYDAFMSLEGNWRDEQNQELDFDFTICETFEAYDLENLQDFVEAEYDSSKTLLEELTTELAPKYAVHVVCNNSLELYQTFAEKDEAEQAYVKLCKEWYSDNGLEAFASAVEYDSEIEHYNGYYNSEEYSDACDNAHVALEVLNA